MNMKTEKVHLIVRKEGILCTRCHQTEPIHQGDGTPMETMIMAYELMARRHQNCISQLKK